MASKFQSNKQVYFLNDTSKFLRFVFETIMNANSYYESKGSWGFETDSQAEEMLNLLSENITLRYRRAIQLKDNFALQLPQGTCSALRWSDNLLRSGLMFSRLAKSKGDTEKARDYLYDTYEELALPCITLSYISRELSKAAREIQDKSATQEKEKQRERYWNFRIISMNLSSVAENIADFELPEDDRKDFAAMARLQYLDYELSKAMNGVDEAKANTSSCLIEETEIILRVLWIYLREIGDIWDMIEGGESSDRIAGPVANAFAKANEHRFEIEKLAVRLQMEFEKTSSSSGQVGNSKHVKMPSKKAMQAYLTLKALSCPQSKVAEVMTDKLKPKKPYKQWRISRWKIQCENWLKANNLDVFPREMTKKIINIDSNKLDMRARTDGKITGDPRHKAKLDPDE